MLLLSMKIEKVLRIHIHMQTGPMRAPKSLRKVFGRSIQNHDMSG